MVHKKIQYVVIHRQTAHFFRLLTENLDELFRSREINLDFIWNTAKKRVIAKLPRLNVRREDDQRVKRNFEFTTTGQRQEFNSLIQRRHPAIQQFLGPHALPSKIVDDKNAVV